MAARPSLSRPFPALLPALLLLAALFWTAGCQTAGEIYQELNPQGTPEERAYAEAITPFLAKGEAYQGGVSTLAVAVLPLNMKVREAMVEREARAYALTVTEKARRQADQDEVYKKFDEVLISLYCPERAWQDLTQTRPTFKVYLYRGRERTEPSDIREIRERTGLTTALYPFWGPWSRLFLARFPLEKNPAAEGRLLVAGAPGQTELPLVLR